MFLIGISLLRYRCKGLHYPENLQAASVIICFYNEEPYVLFRTVQTVLERSDPKILHEVLLVDDSSDYENLHEDVVKYATVNFPSKVKILKTPGRAGLIRARMFGARQATGDVRIFKIVALFTKSVVFVLL